MFYKNVKGGDTLTLKKTAQIYGEILTNHSDHASCPYPKISDPTLILNVGDKIKIVDKKESHAKYRWPYLVAEHNDKKFNILSPDVSRFFI